MLPRIVSEALFRFTSVKVIWFFRIIDIFDITLQTLSLLVLALYVYYRYIYTQGRDYSMMYLALVALLIGGHMMHFAANALDMHFREVLNEDPSSALPHSEYALLHFIDEYLSHLIMFTALVLIILMGSLAEIRCDGEELSTSDMGLIMFSGFILGAGLGISAVEASIPLYMLVLTILALSVVVYRARMDHKNVRKYPFTLYVLVLFTLLILSIATFIAIFGFQSPRELIGSYLEEKFS